jgi:hypothetical protein
MFDCFTLTIDAGLSAILAYLTPRSRSKDMNSPARIPLTELTSRELQERAVEYHQMGVNARGQEVAAALKRLAIRYALLAAHREMEEMASLQAIYNDKRKQTELSKLVALANHAADREPDPVRSLANTIRMTAAGNADLSLLKTSSAACGPAWRWCARLRAANPIRRQDGHKVRV